MSITFSAYAFIAFWLLWCALPFISARKLTLLPSLKTDTLLWRMAEWHLRFPVLIGAGYMLDSLYSNRPHESYAAPEFYAILYTSSLVFSVPAVVLYLARHKKLGI